MTEIHLRFMIPRYCYLLMTRSRYIVSAVIRTSFPRESTEINLGLYYLSNGTHMNMSRFGGLPNSTAQISGNVDGWCRWEWELTTAQDSRIQAGAMAIHVYAPAGSHAPGSSTIRHPIGPPPLFEIADFAAIETPPPTTQAFAVGGGLAFRGSAGDLQMRVLQCNATAVVTTSARYTFDTAKGLISVEQQIDWRRPLSQWQLSHSLSGLHVVEWKKGAAGRCVMATGDSSLSIGVQVDGLLGFVPHTTPLSLTVIAKFAGTFSRQADGHILTEDDWGGFTVSPHSQSGSGVVPKLHAHSDDLQFMDLPPHDVNSTTPAPAGWWATWVVQPGDRLFTSVMPVRPYDWGGSFKFHWAGCYESVERCPSMVGSNGSQPFLNNLILWNAAPHPWGMSWTGPYPPSPNANAVNETVAKLHSVGVKALPYMSAWFHSGRNATEYLGHVAEWKARFGIDGLYTDGLPEDDWTVAYEEMRMLRELFASGTLVVHDTIREEGILPAQYRPFLHAYADATLMAEGMISNDGVKWQWPRYCTSQFRKSNTFGSVKGNKWNGTGMESNPGVQDLVSLLFGGRDRPGLPGYDQYLQTLHALEVIWQQHYADSTDGFESTFYDQYYLPAAQNLTGLRIGRAPMPIAKQQQRNGLVSLELMTMAENTGAQIHYTLDATAVRPQSALYTAGLKLRVPPGGMLRAASYATGLDRSRELTFTSDHVSVASKHDDIHDRQKSTPANPSRRVRVPEQLQNLRPQGGAKGDDDA